MEPFQEENPNCVGCKFRSIPVNAADHFGHTKCSFHRECTGYTYWQPQFCTHCVNAEQAMDQQEPTMRFATMGKFSSMLEKQKAKINNVQPERQWDFKPILDYKFRHRGVPSNLFGDR